MDSLVSCPAHWVAQSCNYLDRSFRVMAFATFAAVPLRVHEEEILAG